MSDQTDQVTHANQGLMDEILFELPRVHSPIDGRPAFVSSGVGVQPGQLVVTNQFGELFKLCLNL